MEEGAYMMLREAGRKGRRPRYGVKTKSLHVCFPPALLERIKEEKLLRQIREPDQEWSAGRVIVTDMARLYGFDLTPQEP
jgi:hypothetical protein